MFFLMSPNGRKNGIRLSVGLVVSHFFSDFPYACNVRDLYSNRCRVYLCKKKKKKEIDGETIKGVESYLVTVWKGFETLSHVAWTAQTSTLGNPFWNDV